MAADQADDALGSGASEVKQPSELDTNVPSRSVQKVELDLEDAPFLEEEEEVKPEPTKPVEAVGLEPEKEPKLGLAGRKKQIIIGAAALLLLIVAAVAVKFLFFKGAATPPAEKTEQAAPAHPAPDNATEAKAEPPEIQVRMEPFWVEQKGEGDEVRFLRVRIMLGTTNPSVPKDYEMKLLAARNAIFYYLKNKDVQFLADEQNAEKLKTELLLVINQYVSDGKFDTLMFEEYVVK